MEKLTFVFIKKRVIICCQKKLFSARKNEQWQNNFYGNADRDSLMELNCPCSRFFEESKDETCFDDFCRRCLYHALRAVSYLLCNLFLENTKCK